jgi:hypothetical protein
MTRGISDNSLVIEFVGDRGRSLLPRRLKQPPKKQKNGQQKSKIFHTRNLKILPI